MVEHHIVLPKVNGTQDSHSKSSFSPISQNLSTSNTISQLTTNTPIEAIMNMLNNRLEFMIELKPKSFYSLNVK